MTDDMKQAVYEAREAERRYVIGLLTERCENAQEDLEGDGLYLVAGILDCIKFLTEESK